MKWPIHIVTDEPRVRRRMWPEDRRARRAAAEAAPTQPDRFVVSLGEPHPANKNPHRGVLYLVGQLNGVITSMITIAVATCSH